MGLPPGYESLPKAWVVFEAIREIYKGDSKLCGVVTTKNIGDFDFDSDAA